MRKLVVVFLVVGATACDSSQAPEPRLVVVDANRPCGLASPDEIAAAIRGRNDGEEPVRAHAGEGMTGVPLCSYDVGPPYASVTLHVETGIAEHEFRARIEGDPLNVDPLEGVGELAFTRAGVEVSVWVDGTAVSASVQHFGDSDETREALEDLAGLIESKL